MDWKVLFTTFATIFIAEVGDKTQLATLSLAAGSRSRQLVFAGAALALIASSAVAAVAGDALARLVPPPWIQRAAGALFLGVVGR